jgi:hypothetical protein
MRLVLIVLALAFVIPCLVSCGGGSRSVNGFPNPSPLPVTLTVSPPTIALVAGSTTTFAASPNPPQGFSLVWLVNPADGGTITNSGVYTAAQTAGNCTVVAAWIPTSSSMGSKVTGSATVTVLRPIALNVNLIEASGAIETSGNVQNAALVGESLPAVTSTDPTGKTQLRSGFPIPVPCGKTDPSCH